MVKAWGQLPGQSVLRCVRGSVCALGPGGCQSDQAGTTLRLCSNFRTPGRPVAIPWRCGASLSASLRASTATTRSFSGWNHARCALADVGLSTRENQMSPSTLVWLCFVLSFCWLSCWRCGVATRRGISNRTDAAKLPVWRVPMRMARTAIPAARGPSEPHASSISVTVEVDPSVAPLLQSNPLYQKSTPASVNIKGYAMWVQSSNHLIICCYSSIHLVFCFSLDALQFDRNQIVQLEDIGVGCFGPVFLAESSQELPGLSAWRAALEDPLLTTSSTPRGSPEALAISGSGCFELPPAPGLSDVSTKEDAGAGAGGTLQRHRFAVRMLDSNKAAADREAFLQVAALMASLHHPCVVALLGVCAPQAPLCMPSGVLRGIATSPHFCATPIPPRHCNLGAEPP